MPASRATSGGAVDEALKDAPAAGPEEAPAAQEAPAEPQRRAFQLPTAKSVAARGLEERSVVIYGPPGIGKSTLASQWGGGDLFFFDTAGELADLEVYREPIPDWVTFKRGVHELTKDVKRAKTLFRGGAIDTIDALARLCSQFVRVKHKFAHEADLDFGRGYNILTEEFLSAMTQLAVMPAGIVMVSHSKTVEIKTDRSSYNKATFTLSPRGVNDAVLKMADLVFYIDWSGDDGNQRIIRTKGDRYVDAKERGVEARLPGEIVWPIGTNGWDLIKKEWEKR